LRASVDHILHIFPLDRFPKEFLVDAVKDFLSDASMIVVGPTANDGIENPNQGNLRTASILADKLFELVEMSFDGLLGWFDKSIDALLQAENVPLDVFPR
jgi:hypothetical protein